MKKRNYILALWIMYSAVIFAISITPKTAIRSEIPYFDKFLHCGAFVVFALLSTLSLARFPNRNLITVVLAASYGAIIEIVQYFVPGREASLYDWLADMVGVLIGILLVAWWRHSTKLAR